MKIRIIIVTNLLLLNISNATFAKNTSADKTAETAFTEIYDNGVWGRRKDGKGSSGEGSSIINAKVYIEFLRNFLKTHNIKSVVDAGCGDWTFSQEIDWSGIHYIGYDVVKSIIEENCMKFSNENCKFIYGDITKINLPSADLLLCKDVLQHLPNKDIMRFLKQCSNFKHCLITNDVDLHKMNNNIKRGEYRPIDLTQEPFNITGFKILTYVSEGWNTKQVLHISPMIYNPPCETSDVYYTFTHEHTFTHEPIDVVITCTKEDRKTLDLATAVILGIGESKLTELKKIDDTDITKSVQATQPGVMNLFGASNATSSDNSTGALIDKISNAVYYNTPQQDLPYVTIAILAKDKAHTLPLYLSCIEHQTWPAYKTYLYIRTNNNNDDTANILRTWIEKVRTRYASIYFDDTNVSEPVQKYEQHEWNVERFKVLGKIRQESVAWAQLHKSHYFVVDCDNFIKPNTLKTLVETNLSIVSPLLKTTTRYSNFHADVDECGYFKYSPLYDMLLEQKIKGLVEVPVVHCTYLIRYDLLDNILYDDGSNRYEYVIFSDTARKKSIYQFLDTRDIYGYLTFAKNESELLAEPWLYKMLCLVPTSNQLSKLQMLNIIKQVQDTNPYGDGNLAKK
jgi:SAM-dependent methyltransferase